MKKLLYLCFAQMFYKYLLIGCWRDKSIWDWQIDSNSSIPTQWPASWVEGGSSNSPSGVAICVRKVPKPPNDNAWRSRKGFLGRLLSIQALPFKCTSCPSRHECFSRRYCLKFLTLNNGDNIETSICVLPPCSWTSSHVRSFSAASI